MDIEQTISNLKDQIIKLLGEEESLRDQKNAQAKEFRLQINETKAKRIKAVNELADIEKSLLEEEGTLYVTGKKDEASNSKTANV